MVKSCCYNLLLPLSDGILKNQKMWEGVVLTLPDTWSAPVLLMTNSHSKHNGFQQFSEMQDCRTNFQRGLSCTFPCQGNEALFSKPALTLQQLQYYQAIGSERHFL